MDDLEQTRRRLAEAQARLAADPENPALARQVFRLENALACLEWWKVMEHKAARGRLIIHAAMRRN
jgi:hypothetical protein